MWSGGGADGEPKLMSHWTPARFKLSSLDVDLRIKRVWHRMLWQENRESEYRYKYEMWPFDKAV